MSSGRAGWSYMAHIDIAVLLVAAVAGRTNWRECIGKPFILYCCAARTWHDSIHWDNEQRPSRSVALMLRVRTNIHTTDADGDFSPKQKFYFLHRDYGFSLSNIQPTSRSVPICIFKIILSTKIEWMLSAAAAAAVRCSSTCRQVI